MTRATTGDADRGSDRDRVRVAAYGLCRDDDGRVLLCHIAPSVGAGDLWTLPGGGLEFGESPTTAVVRELAEETGYVGVVTELLDVGDRLFGDVDGVGGPGGPGGGGRLPGGGGRLHAIRIVYAMRIVGGELRDESDGSTDRCRWVALDQTDRLRLGELARLTLDRLRDDPTPAAAADTPARAADRPG
ncbi:MAG: NUDIX domain-containing protein [Candidatus Limnocylindrales bacterium]